jgi:glutaredoxin
MKVYVKEGCPWCVELENFLKSSGLDYERIEVLSNLDKFEEMKQLSGQSKAPVVVFDSGEILADTDADAVQQFLVEHGQIKSN